MCRETLLTKAAGTALLPCPRALPHAADRRGIELAATAPGDHAAGLAGERGVERRLLRVARRPRTER